MRDRDRDGPGWSMCPPDVVDVVYLCFHLSPHFVPDWLGLDWCKRRKKKTNPQRQTWECVMLSDTVETAPAAAKETWLDTGNVSTSQNISALRKNRSPAAHVYVWNSSPSVWERTSASCGRQGMWCERRQLFEEARVSVFIYKKRADNDLSIPSSTPPFQLRSNLRWGARRDTQEVPAGQSQSALCSRGADLAG